MNITQKNIILSGMIGVFLALALVLGGCEQPTDSTGSYDGPGEETLPVSGDVVNESDYNAATSVSGDVSATGLGAFSGRITSGVLKGSVSGVLSEASLTSTLNEAAAKAFINGTLAPTEDKFTVITVTPQDAKFIELKLKVNSKDLKNEEIVTDLAEYQHYVYVSKAVTITTTGKSVTVDKPLKAGTGTTSVAAEDITLSLQVGWNTFYESYDFEDGTYTIVRDELDHWVYYNN